MYWIIRLVGFLLSIFGALCLGMALTNAQSLLREQPSLGGKWGEMVWIYAAMGLVIVPGLWMLLRKKL